MTSSFPNIPNGSDHASLIPHDLGGNSRSMAAITILSNLVNKWRQIFKAINSSRLDSTMVTYTEPRWPLSRRLQKEGNIVFWMSQVCTQRARKFEKVQAKKLVKSNKSFFSWNCISGSFLTFVQFKNWFLVILEIAKNGIWSKKNFLKLIYLISRVFFLD